MKNDTASKSGSAVITLTNDRVYEGEIEVAGPYVHFRGQRRHDSYHGTRYYPASDQTWPHHKIDAIRWLKAAA